MKKQHLSTLLILVLIFSVFSFAHADDDSSVTPDVGIDVNTIPSRTPTRIRTGEDFRAALEAQRATLEAQRMEAKEAIEARRAEAQSRGDEVQAKREEVRLQIEDRRAEMDAKREELRAQAEAKRAERQEKRAEFRQDRAERKVANAKRIITATIERLEKIASRIDSRIEKIQERGGDTAEGEAFVAAARVNLSDARASLANFDGLDLTGDTAQDNFETIRAIGAEVRELIREAHGNLVAAIRSLNLSSASRDPDPDSDSDDSTDDNS